MDLDTHLRQLVLDAQRHPRYTKQRQIALSRLIAAIQQSGRLDRPRQGDFKGLYTDIYAVALQQLFAFVCDRIDDYNPSRGEVMQWVNFLLRKRFFVEASREFMPVALKGMDVRQYRRLTLEDLDRCHPSEANPHLAPLMTDEVRQWIEDDPDGLFQATYANDNPRATFQAIALWRLDQYSWQAIADQVGEAIPTLSCFYQRCVKKFAPLLRQYLQP